MGKKKVDYEEKYDDLTNYIIIIIALILASLAATVGLDSPRWLLSLIGFIVVFKWCIGDFKWKKRK